MTTLWEPLQDTVDSELALPVLTKPKLKTVECQIKDKREVGKEKELYMQKQNCSHYLLTLIPMGWAE